MTAGACEWKLFAWLEWVPMMGLDAIAKTAGCPPVSAARQARTVSCKALQLAMHGDGSGGENKYDPHLKASMDRGNGK